MRKNIYYYLQIIFLFAIDQLAKFLVEKNIPVYSKVEVIPGFFNLSHIHNRGAIFGFFSQVDGVEVQIILALGSFIAFGFVIFYFLRTPASSILLKTSLSLIVAGAMGNLFDRIWRGYVVDFLDFYIKRWHWPNFNVADSCITVGVVILLFVFFIKGGE